MEEKLYEIILILEDLLNENLPSKSKQNLSEIIFDLKKQTNIEELLKVQDDLEYFSNTANIDSFVRNEIMNIIAEIETLF